MNLLYANTHITQLEYLSQMFHLYLFFFSFAEEF